MKIFGIETRRSENSTFCVNVVDNLDSVYSICKKSSFWDNADSYKKYVFTNGTTEKVAYSKEGKSCCIEFKVIDGDWLIIFNDENNMTMYICEQYCGPIIVKNKKVQETIDMHYTICRERIESKRNFAKTMGGVSRRLNLPFTIVLAFKGDEVQLKQLVLCAEMAINNAMYNDENLMKALASKYNDRREQAIRELGIIKIPNYQSEKIAKYLLECLAKKKIIRRDD